MNRTFLVAIELPDDADVNAEADNILDLLLEDYNVTSVRPWGQLPQPTLGVPAPPSILPTPI